MNSRYLIVGLAVGLASLARADFTPVPLDPTSFNADPVIEKTAPGPINDYVTVTLDQGTNKNNNTVYEVGYNTTNLNSGIPVHNSIVTVGTHSFQMAPDYHTNNVAFVGHGNSSWTPIQGPATFKLATPAAFSSLSFLSDSGNGPCLIKYVLHFTDNSTEEGTFNSLDWFNSTEQATRLYDAKGLVGLNGALNNQSANHGSGFFADVTVVNPSLAISSIDFYWWGQNTAKNPWQNGRTFIYAVSGSTDGTTFSPITVSGYNQDGIMEADAPLTFGCGPVAQTGILTNDNTYCSFTMDGGSNKVNWTWYEKGYYKSFPETGLPAGGATIDSATRPYIHYTMPSSYVGNCAVCLSVDRPSAQIKFATPTAAGGLSLLAGGGNNGTPLNIRCEIQFQNGSTETNWISMVDWFNRTDPWAFVTFGQVAPGSRAVRNTPDQFPNVFLGGQPFDRDPRLGGAQNPSLPIVRLYDIFLPVTNNTALISSINLYTTNTGAWSQTASFFAVSAGAGLPPVMTQPASLTLDSVTGTTNASAAGAVANDIRFTKGYEGINNIALWVSNRLGDSVTYQWKKAPKGGGWRDLWDTYDFSTFANVSAPNIGGANSPIMVITNATLNDSGDYLLVASNPYGYFTSFVATVTVLTTNTPILVGQGFGDNIIKWSNDGTSGNGQETFVKAIDQAQQKWLSTGLGAAGYDFNPIPQGTVPFVGPVGFTVTPVQGASTVKAIRFYSANDSPGRDPRDYFLEGSNDGNNWSPITGGELLGTRMLPPGRGPSVGATAINPLTQPCAEVNFPNTTAYKQYRLTITNVVEPTATPLMQIAEIQLLGALNPTAPSWVRQPVPNVTVYVGANPTWGVLAGGYPAPHFQWLRGGSPIPNATNSTYTLTNAQLSDTGAQISCQAINNGGTITSSSSTLSVIAAPTQGYPATVISNRPLAYFRLGEGPDDGVGNEGVVCHDYMGGHNGTFSNVVLALPGYNPIADPDTATGFGSLISADSFVDNINFIDFARNTNAPGATFSVEAWVQGGLQITNAAIVSKGYNGILTVGTGTGTEQFALDLVGPSPYKFRFLVRDFFGNGYTAQSTLSPTTDALGNPGWHHLVGVCDQPNGKVYLYVDGLLAATGTIPPNVGILEQTMPMAIGSRPNTAASDYDNQWNGIIDDVAVYPAALNAGQVLADFYAAQHPPLMTLNPTNTTTPDNVPVTFYSAAYGPGTLSYQWYTSTDGLNPAAPVPGQTSSNMTFTATPAQNNVTYVVVVNNAYGAVTSSIATLTVVSGAPTFISDLPASGTVYMGHLIQLHVYPGGTAPFTFQWMKDNVPLTDDFRTTGTKSDTLTIAYADLPDSASYSVVVTGQGSTTSTIDAINVVSNSSSFFNASSQASDWSLQGSTAPVLANNSIQLTSGLGSTDRSAFLNTKRNIASFTCGFTYQVSSGTGGADGATFCIQNSAVNARGGAGGGLGYSGITPSWALAFNIYASNTRGINSLNGGTVTTPFAPILPVDLGNNANQVQVDLTYNGTILNAKFTDLTTKATYTTNITVNIPSLVGGSTAWVGFTGADGGTVSTQIVSWGNPTPTPLPLTAKVVGGNLVLSWPSSAGAFLLTSPSLSAPAWAKDTHQWSLAGANSQVIVPPSGGPQFFRLQLFP